MTRPTKARKVAPASASECANVLAYLRIHQRLDGLSNDDLCREILKVAPVFGMLGELIDIAVERLSPGIIVKLAKEEKKAAAPSASRKGRK